MYNKRLFLPTCPESGTGAEVPLVAHLSRTSPASVRRACRFVLLAWGPICPLGRERSRPGRPSARCAQLERKATLSSSSSQGPEIRDRPSRMALVAVQHGDVPAAGGAVLRMVTEIDCKPSDPE